MPHHRFTRTFYRTVRLAVLALILSTLGGFAAAPAQAAGNPAISVTKLTDAIPARSATASTTPWFDKTFAVSYPGSGPAIVSSNADGTFILQPFDRLQILVAGKVVVEESFWENNCLQTVPVMFIPVNISSFLKAGQNQVGIKFFNHCPKTGSPSGYLVIGRPGTNAPYDPPGSITGPPNNGCGTAKLFGVRGSGETSKDDFGYGKTIGPLVPLLAAAVPGLDAQPIHYWAIAVDLNPTHTTYPSNYVDSVNDGVINLQRSLRIYFAKCPAHYAILAGYSQGAEVVRRAFLGLTQAEQARVASVVLFGDPEFNPTDKAIDKRPYESYYGINKTLLGDLPMTVDSRWSSRFQSYCASGDPICNFTKTNGANCWNLGNQCPHLLYNFFGFVQNSVKGIIKDLRSIKVI